MSGWKTNSKYLFGTNPVAYEASFTDRRYGFRYRPSITARSPGDVALIWQLALDDSVECFVTETQTL